MEAWLSDPATAPPPRGTPEHAHWMRGAAAETACRTEGRSAAGLEVREFIDGLAEHHHELDRIGIVTLTADVYTAGNRRARWRLLRG